MNGMSRSPSSKRLPFRGGRDKLPGLPVPPTSLTLRLGIKNLNSAAAMRLRSNTAGLAKGKWKPILLARDKIQNAPVFAGSTARRETENASQSPAATGGNIALICLCTEISYSALSI
jgi:hypothetical protein